LARTFRFREEARGVVVANERNQPLRMRVERILAQNFGQLRHGFAVRKHVAQSEVDGEVERRVEPRVDALVRRSSGERTR
jgi:hypothetical protein